MSRPLPRWYDPSLEIPVLLRRDKEGVYALFPTLPGTNAARTCLMYQHVGQHGTADLYHCLRESEPARAEPDTLALLAELRGPPFGYFLRPVERVTQWMHEQRAAALARK